MKKRKPPIVLISVGIILAIVIVMMNMPRDERPDVKKEATTESRTTSSKEDIARETKKSVKRTMDPDTVMDQQAATGKSILMPKPSESKPIPNDSSITGQWYNSESSTSRPAPTGK